MTTTRDAFEATYAAINPRFTTKDIAWVCYQAATLAERERCALVCDDQSDCANNIKNTQARLACDDLADAIRSGK